MRVSVTRWCRQVATWRGYRVPPGSVLVTTCHPGHVLAGDRDVVLSGAGAFEIISKYFYLQFIKCGLYNTRPHL